MAIRPPNTIFLDLRRIFQTMTKRILALILCLAMLCTALFGCAKKSESDVGAYITMYLTDDIFDFDPANAYYNSDAINVLSMMYETLFTLDKDGKVQKGLVESYKAFENTEINEYYLELTLKEAYWNVKDQLTANDVVFAWKRLVDFRNSYDAASLLYDIKNARAIKEGDISIDDLGVEAVEDRVVRITFESPIDYDQFFLNLTSVATAPLLERYVSANEDWAKKASTIATSGPFKLSKITYAETGEKTFDDNGVDKKGEAVVSSNNKVKKIAYFILERNAYYYRDTDRDAIDSSVKPFRLLVDCTMAPEDLVKNFDEGKIFYIDNIPLSLRTGDNAEWVQKNAKVSDALSTFVCQLNQNALIDDGANGSYLFADAKVRQALSLVIDRTAIKNAVVFAEAATALVPPGVFDKGMKDDFRSSKLAKDLVSASPNKEAALQLLSDAGIEPSKYSFSIKAAAYDEVHMTMAEMVKNYWCDLGFNVTVEPMYAIENNDYFAQTDSVPPDVCDDLFIENVRAGDFEVLAVDLCAFTADAYSVLSNYAYAFSGSMYSDPDNDIYEYNPHLSGYDSVAYNILMEAVYYIPFYASLEALATGVAETEPYVVSHAASQPYVESAKSAMRKLNDAITAATQAEANLVAVMILATQEPTEDEDGELIEPEKVSAEAFTYFVNELANALVGLDAAGQEAVKNIVAAQVGADLTTASQNASSALSAKAKALQSTAKDALTKIEALKAAETALAKANGKTQKEQAKAAYEIAYAETVTALVASTETLITEINAVTSAAATAMQTAVDGASKQTLKEAIKAIYDANGIVPTTKESKWGEQRSILLHKAEEHLIGDYAVIPVVYNQNAVIVSKKLSKVTPTYYTPAYFRKTKLKNYIQFYYVVDEEKNKMETIFKDFPTVAWDKIG